MVQNWEVKKFGNLSSGSLDMKDKIVLMCEYFFIWIFVFYIYYFVLHIPKELDIANYCWRVILNDLINVCIFVFRYSKRWSNFFNYYFVEKNFNFNLQYFIRIKLDRYVIDSREINKFIFCSGSSIYMIDKKISKSSFETSHRRYNVSSNLFNSNSYV